MNASPITAIRTAAVSGVATKALAREDARVLAIVGAGHQAYPHVEAMLAGAAVRRDPGLVAEPARAPSGLPPSGRRPVRWSRTRRPCAVPT